MPSAKPAAALPLSKLLASLTEVRESLPRRQHDVEEAVTRLASIERELRAAVKAEDFERAAVLKRERTEVETRRDVAKEALRSIRAGQAEMLERASSLFFADQGARHFAEGAQVTRVVVVDPATQDSDSVDYVDSCESVSLSVGDKHFNSEAYHLADWAAENGFLIGLRRGRVVFDS